MDSTNGRSFSKINHDTKRHVDHDHTYSVNGKKKKYFKAHHNQTYSKSSHEYRCSYSSNHKSIEKRSLNITPAKQNTDQQFIESGSSDKPKSSSHVSAKLCPTGYESVEYRIAENKTAELTSFGAHSLALHKTDDYSSIKIITNDDIAKCLLMKVYPKLEPKLRQLLHCILKDKQDSETLEMYAKRHGMQSKWPKHFSAEQIKNIRQSPDFSSFDSTLVFRCIEVLKDFNPILIKDENLKIYIDNTMKDLKYPRNLLCHNRIILTAKKSHGIANNLKRPLEDLIDIIHIWDREINITDEKMKIWKEVKGVMNSELNKNDFSYMRLLKFINYTGESELGKILQLICYEKKKSENFKEYFKRNGMNSKTFKDTFYKEEKDFLESNLAKIQPDLTLHCKMIEACSKYHPLLKKNERVRTDLLNILKEMRGIRNHAIHNMLSLSSKECDENVQKLEDSLKYLVHIVNLI